MRLSLRCPQHLLLRPRVTGELRRAGADWLKVQSTVLGRHHGHTDDLLLRYCLVLSVNFL